MMTNLFSIFDPSSSLGSSTNWASLMLGSVLLPMKKWVPTPRFTMFFYSVVQGLYKEVKALLPVSSGVSPIIFIAMFMFILFNNLFGLAPYVFTATGHLVVTLSIALPLWLGYFSYGWVVNFKWMMAHLVPQGTPTVLMPFMVVIESISSLIRPMTLAVRLAANMIAGHLLLTLMSNSASALNFSSAVSLVLLQIMLLVLEVAVAAIQSYVLVILSVLYTSEV